MTVYPGFSTADMDDIFSLTARVAAMTAVEAAVATAQAREGVIPTAAAEAIVTACREPVSVDVLAQGWDVGTPVLPLLDELRGRLPPDAAGYLHRDLTTQDVVDTATMIYDQLPVNDVFRKLDDRTVIGAMDLRGSKKPYFFVLTRDNSLQVR